MVLICQNAIKLVAQNFTFFRTTDLYDPTISFMNKVYHQPAMSIIISFHALPVLVQVDYYKRSHKLQI